MSNLTKTIPSTRYIKYDSYLDLIRVAAAFLVVFLHVNAYGAYAVNVDNWKVAIGYDSIARISVPLFFMLSGALLIPIIESGVRLLRRIVKRILLPYIIWSLIYILYNHYIGNPTIPLWEIFLTPAYYHMNFMLQLLAVYLALPLLRTFWNHPDCSKKTKLYIIILALLSGPVNEFLPQFNISIIRQFSFLPYYAGFAMLGAYLRDYEPVKSWPKAIICIFLWLLFSTITFIMTITLTNKIGSLNETFFLYSSPLVILATLCFFRGIQFIYMSLTNFTNTSISSFIRMLSEQTMNVYFLHPLLLNIFTIGVLGFILSWNTYNPIYFSPIYTALIITICTIFGFAIQWTKSIIYLFIKTIIKNNGRHIRG